MARIYIDKTYGSENTQWFDNWWLYCIKRESTHELYDQKFYSWLNDEYGIQVEFAKNTDTVIIGMWIDEEMLTFLKLKFDHADNS